MKILILLSVLIGCHGYSYVIPASLRTPGICFYNGRILPQGESRMPMVCQVTDCRADGSILVNGCGRISLPNCTLVENVRLSKPYPDCCEMTYQCIDSDGITFTKEWNEFYSDETISSSTRNYFSIPIVAGLAFLAKLMHRIFGGFL